MKKLQPLVSAHWLAKHFNDEHLVILDASPRSNKSGIKVLFPGQTIKNAIKFDMEQVFVEKHNSIPNMIPSSAKFEEECQKLGINEESVIIVFDNLGMYTSPRARWMFKVMGHDAVAVLDGGLNEWIKAGFECSTVHTLPSGEKGNFKAVYNPSLVVDSNAILENIKREEFKVLDARSENRFYGKVPEPRAGMSSGHIPRSLNIPFKSVLENGKMKQVEELKPLFNEVSEENEPLAFSCGSGITACIIMLASELVQKNKTMLYDGSWSEWGREGVFPVTKDK